MQKNQSVKWYFQPVAVIVLLFFVLGPLGLPLLYRSPKFSRAGKILLTVLTLVYTLYLVFAAYKISLEMYEKILG